MDLFLIGLVVVGCACIALGWFAGEAHAWLNNRRQRRLEVRIMASLTRIEAAVAAVVAYVATLKANQEDPAQQARLDELAAQLEAAAGSTPPS